MNNIFRKGAKLVQESKNILVFSGAGLSTESGIPDFRSPGGFWEKYTPSDFYFDRILSDETSREKYWQMSTDFYSLMKDARPNRAYTAIKKIEDMGRLLAIVTQNVDSLHHKAGNSSDKIIEIHGTAFTVSCLQCGKTYKREEIEKRIDTEKIRVPYCDVCAGILKPDTVSFGQSMPENKLAKAFSMADKCDLCMVLGSSLVVYPAASVPEHAVKNGAKLIIVNKDATHLDNKADLLIHDSLSKAMDCFIANL